MALRGGFGGFHGSGFGGFRGGGFGGFHDGFFWHEDYDKANFAIHSNQPILAREATFSRCYLVAATVANGTIATVIRLTVLTSSMCQTI